MHLEIEYDTSCPMALSDRSELKGAIGELFQTQRAARRLADEIAGAPADLLLEVLAEAAASARKHDSPEEGVLELQAIAQILGQIEGPRAVDALIDILG